MKKILLFLLLFSCRNAGFYQPFTQNMEIPDGPPEYKAGWRAGCRDGMGAGNFANSVVYPIAYFGPGNYHHEGLFNAGFVDALFSCFEQGVTFTQVKPLWEGPLQ